MNIHIKNGRLIDPLNKIDAQLDVFIADKRIAAIGKAPQGFAAEQVIDASGLIVIPGLVDVAARLREPGYEYKATLESEMDAAMAGGVTSLSCPPDTDPPLDEPGLVEMLKHRARSLNQARVFPVGALTYGLKGAELTEMIELTEAGCKAFSQADTTLTDTRVLLRAMQYAATFGYRVWLRPQDAFLAKDGVAHDGEVATRLGLPAIPVVAETIALATMLQLAQETGVKLHVCRISSAEGVAMVRAAKRQGLAVTCDVSMNHVHLSEMDIGFFDSNCHLMPPLRSLSDKAALRAGLLDGTIDAICSNHSPVDEDAKQLPFAEAEAGATGMELLLPLVLKWAEEDKVPLPEALAHVTINPAQLLGVKMGHLSVGAHADLCLFDPAATWKVEPAALKSQGKNTPFNGYTMQGRVRHTVVEGKVAYSLSLVDRMNPLLDFSGLPRFAEFKTEHVTPAVEELLTRNRKLLAKLLADMDTPTWENFVQPFEDANEHLARAWGQVGHLNMVMNSPALREVYNANLPKVTQYYAELSQNHALFEKYKAIRNGKAYAALSAAQKKVIENELRDFRLGGAELPENKKARFMAIQEELSELTSKFSDNLLDATNAYTCVVAVEQDISGVPGDERQVAAEAAQEAGKKGWLFTLKAPSYGPVMQYADSRSLRERMYRAYTTRASEQMVEGAKEGLDNTPLMTRILQLRAEEAQMLGFANFAELSLASKMADTPQQVAGFLRELAQRARPFAEKDLAELREFAAVQLGMKDLQAWDVGYASEKLRQQRYAFSEQEVKQYFPEDAVLQGLFGLVETLFGLKIKPSTAPVWHEAVRFFDICDHQGTLIGQFYLDLYARASKRGGAWMDDAITRRRTATGIQTPVAYLNCNFAAPVGGKPALFTHDEVITLFHEFGHGLHHLLTQVEELGVSGISGVEWDAVELPSQFMENFCWEWDVLQGMTRHSETRAKMPRELFDKMIAAKNFQSGLQMLRQIEFSLFDLRLHSDYDASGTQTVQQLLDEVRAEVAVMIPPAFNRFQNSFSHIFAGGYAAGYYSYKWAEVLSADAYSLFEENGVLDAATGSHFREQILAVGGSRDAMDSFIAFRGREPRIDALLRHNGLVNA